jgi:hypothetical protein
MKFFDVNQKTGLFARFFNFLFYSIYFLYLRRAGFSVGPVAFG